MSDNTPVTPPRSPEVVRPNDGRRAVKVTASMSNILQLPGLRTVRDVDGAQSPAFHSIATFSPQQHTNILTVAGEQGVSFALNALDYAASQPDEESRTPAPSPDIAVLPRSWRATAASILDHVLTRWSTAICTIYVLFVTEIRLLAFDSTADDVFSVMSFVCFIIMICEIFLRATAESDWVPAAEYSALLQATQPWSFNRVYYFLRRFKGYLFSLLFWMDVIALLSLMPEIKWFLSSQSSTVVTAVQSLQLTKASRLARVGSRLGRLLRFTRLSGLLAVYCGFNRSSWLNPSHRHLGQVRESQMGVALSDSVTKTALLLILPLILLIPLFYYRANDVGPENAVNAVHALSVARPAGWEMGFASLRSYYMEWRSWDDVLPEDVGTKRLVKLLLTPSVPALEVDLPQVYERLRHSFTADELEEYSITSPAAWDPTVMVTTEVWYNVKPVSRYNAMLSIIFTVFVLVVLLLGTLVFTADAHRLVLRPIECMIAFVERTAMDPMGAEDASSKDNTGAYEIKLLENTIKKVVGILRVGFGMTGLLTVGRHLGTQRAKLQQEETLRRLATTHARNRSDGNLISDPTSPIQHKAVNDSLFDPYQRGRFVRAVFLRIQVPHFDGICQILGEDAVKYSNKIAKIVHDMLLSWGGSPIANTGHGYLGVWVIDDMWEERFSALADVSMLIASKNMTLEEPQFVDNHAVASGVASDGMEKVRRRRGRRASLGAAITGLDVARSMFRRDVASPGDDDGSSHISRSARPSHLSPQMKTQSATASPVASSKRTQNPMQVRPSPVASVAPSTTNPIGVRDSPASGGGAPEEDMLVSVASEAADRALIACMKIIAAVRRSADVALSTEARNIRNSAELKGHQLWLECGLHVGWAIEGAVGTINKVDANYLSAHVEQTNLMQSLCSVYGTQIVCSGAFHKFLSPAAAALCSPLDRVSLESTGDVAGRGKNVISLYGVDVFDWNRVIRSEDIAGARNEGNVSAVAPWKTPRFGPSNAAPIAPPPTPLRSSTHGLLPFAALTAMKNLDADAFNVNRKALSDHERSISMLGEADIIDHPIVKAKYSVDAFQEDPELVALRAPFTETQMHLRRDAVYAYLSGDWAAARSRFEALMDAADTTTKLAQSSNDASSFVYSYMQQHNFVPPPDWRGYRQL